MAYNHATMLGEVEAVIASTWTDVLPANDGGGIWDMEQIRRRAFDSVIDPAEGGALPFAVYDLGPSTSADWGLVNDAQEADFTFYYITQVALTNLAVRAKGEALKSALVVASYTGMSILEKSGEQNDMNAILQFFLDRFVPYTAGSFSLRVVYGESWF